MAAPKTSLSIHPFGNFFGHRLWPQIGWQGRDGFAIGAKEIGNGRMAHQIAAAGLVFAA